MESSQFLPSISTNKLIWLQISLELIEIKSYHKWWYLWMNLVELQNKKHMLNRLLLVLRILVSENFSMTIWRFVRMIRLTKLIRCHQNVKRLLILHQLIFLIYKTFSAKIWFWIILVRIMLKNFLTWFLFLHQIISFHCLTCFDVLSSIQKTHLLL